VLLAEGDALTAMGPLRRAFEAWQGIGAPYIAARIRVSLARACRSVGDLEGAELELEAAREVFERLGAAPDLASLSGEVPAAGDRPRAAAGGLTPRELEVLRLVARGLTNKLIASELFLSEKTVDRHVSNIFGKIGVTTRAAATAFAYEKKLV
jgi:DNA-binding NarL/FixJ family response regulator